MKSGCCAKYLMSKTMDLTWCFAVVLSWICHSGASPVVTVCPQFGIATIGDTFNSTVFYRCDDGVFSQPVRCAPGSCVPRYHYAENDMSPCIMDARKCPYPNSLAMIPIRNRIASVTVKEHAYDAMYMDPAISTVADCVAACAATGNCLAVDFNEAVPACFLHNITSACQRTYFLPDDDVLHIKLVTCVAMAVTYGTYVPGGMPVAVNSIKECMYSCNGTCLGLDFNNATNKCFIHDHNTVCAPMVQHACPTCTTFKKINCPLPLVQEGAHVFGGNTVANVRELAHCWNTCTGSCLAIDFDFLTKTCYHHSAKTACDTIYSKNLCLHITNVDCQAPGTAFMLPGVVPDGYSSRHDFSFVFDGKLMSQPVTEQQCIGLCLEETDCLAVDYDMTHQACYKHNITTYCKTMFRNENVNHYKRAECSSTEGAFRAAFHNLVTGDGYFLCRKCNQTECSQACAEESGCLGVDFDPMNKECRWFGFRNVCFFNYTYSPRIALRKVLCP